MIDTAVTTAYKPSAKIVSNAKALAEEYSLDFFPRGSNSLIYLVKTTGIETWLVCESDSICLYSEGQKKYFHLNMAELRIRAWEKNKDDYFAQLLSSISANVFLDCTFGIGSDSLMASYVLPTTQIIALEKQWPLFLLGKIGINYFTHQNHIVNDALRRINLYHEDAYSFLGSRLDKSIDIIYFDFMFSHTVAGSTNLDLLRQYAAKDKMTKKLWIEAERVVKKRIIVKDRPFGKWLRTNAPDYIIGGKYSKVRYGVWDYA